MSKVSSAPALTGAGSSGLLKKMGKMMKRTKSSGNQGANLSEDTGICQSEDSFSDNQEESIYEDEPIHMKPCPDDLVYIDQDQASGSGSDFYEDEIVDPPEEVVPPPPPRPPPPPPPAPPLPPRSSAHLAVPGEGPVPSPSPQEDEKQPVLPPRNRVSGNFSLETVVPVAQGVVPPAAINGWGETFLSHDMLLK